MRFILRMAAREIRASWRRLVFFFICVALGVGAIAAMRSVIQTVRGALTREARSLTGADVIIQTSRPWELAAREAIAAALRAFPQARVTEVVETATMARPDAQEKALARMVELQAVRPGFPFYGEIGLQSGRPYRHDQLRNRGVIVRPELLAQLDLREGDRLVIGGEAFEIRGVLTNEPGRRPGLFSLGPRVMIDAADLERTALLGFGSRARYQILVSVPESSLARLVADLRQRLRGRFVTVRSFRDTQERIGRELQTAENYLSLVGYVIVVLGGIGVWSVTRVFMQQKMRAIAMLKCLGASSRRILAVYVVQVLVLGALGSLAGLALAAILLGFVPPDLFAAFPGLRHALTREAALQSAGVGLLVSLLFAVVPLLGIRTVRPLLLLREEAGRSGPRVDPWRVVAGAAVVVALAALASWQASSWRVGLVVSTGFVALALALGLAGVALVWAVRPLGRVRWFPLRHAILGFGRPGHQTRVILLAVGLGSFFILGVQLLAMNLRREFSLDLRADAPDLFLVDIQADQRDAVERFLSSQGRNLMPRLMPVMRVRVAGMAGQAINLSSVEDVRERGELSREFVATWRQSLAPNEQIVDGRLWSSPDPSVEEVSVEVGLVDRAGLRLGDRIRFDILGRPVEAQITSVRRVQWEDARQGGFMFVFKPGLLDRAPHTYLGTIRAPDDPVARARLQRDLVMQFPNVSAIDVREIVDRVQRVLRTVTVAISGVGAIAILCGLLILVGSVAMTKFQRLQEMALLKTLGASSRVIGAMLVIEYGVLGLVAGTIGALGAIALSYAFARYVLDITWSPELWTAAAGVGVTAVVVALVGVMASWDVLRRKPLAVLRAG